jgi:paraquat-inducible protein A
VSYIASDSRASGLIACPECDLLQREPPPIEKGAVDCVRCGALLYRTVPHAIELALALMSAAAILFVMANVFPVMSLGLQGRYTAETFYGMAQSLAEAGMLSVALLVAVTLIVVPAVRILALLCALVPLRLGRVPKALPLASRLLTALRPWSMVEVFILGALVSMGRLNDVGDLDLDVGFWSITGVMLLQAAADSILDQRDLWRCAAALEQGKGTWR